tara:strand:- start:393 stop:584 length:192 start_codon:yes stop_codon:yes gene_type:complete
VKVLDISLANIIILDAITLIKLTKNKAQRPFDFSVNKFEKSNFKYLKISVSEFLLIKFSTIFH